MTKADIVHLMTTHVPFVGALADGGEREEYKSPEVVWAAS